MQRNTEHTIVWLVIAFGILLRLLNIEAADFETDETQAALFATQAWPPLGMAILAAAQEIFGHTIPVVRGVSAVVGIATIPLFYFLARELQFRQSGALLVTALLAIFPSHIQFSRLAYLSIQQCFAWILLLFAFLRTRRDNGPQRLVAVFLVSVAATFIKPQGALVPALLLFGTLLEQWRRRTNNMQLATVLFLSLVPISLYVATSPGIPATLLLYGGNMYGFSQFPSRIAMVTTMWWNVLGFFLIALFLSLPRLRQLPWPVHVLLFIGSTIGLVLGPEHEYYATHLVLFSLPMGMAMARWKLLPRNIILCILMASTFFTLGPRIAESSGYWNTHAEKINTLLEDEDKVTVLGYAGHQLRWYLEPEVLVGRKMPKPYPTSVVMELKGSGQWEFTGRVLYEDGYVRLVRQ